MYYKKIALLIILSCLMANQGNRYAYSIGVLGLLPQNEFKDAGVTSGIGIDFNGVWYPINGMGVGLNFGGSIYDKSSREIPFSYYSDLITITEETENNILYGHLFFNVLPQWFRFRPSIEGLVGFKTLQTKTALYNHNCYDNPDTSYDECEIASSLIDTPESKNSTALSYGWGVGLEVVLNQSNTVDENGALSFFINGRYLYGNEASYLKAGDITFSDPEDGPVESTFNWNESKTDVFQITFGIKGLSVLY